MLAQGHRGTNVVFFCQKPDHLIADCALYKRKSQPPVAKPPKGVGLIKTVSPCGSQLVLKEPDECFRPFISKGLVSTGKPEDQRLVSAERHRWLTLIHPG